MLRYLWVAVTVVALDQLSKLTALKYLVPHVSVPLVPTLNFTLTFNRGAAFGFLNSAPGWQNFFFIGVALIASVAIVVWLRRLTVRERLLAVALGLILGGAVGNVLDRFFYQYVVDFIDFYIGTWHFWTFNVADAAISIGAVLLLADSFFSSRYRVAQ
jgi:signal peptidase II